MTLFDSDSLDGLQDTRRAKTLCAQIGASADAAAVLELLTLTTRAFRRFNDSAAVEDVARNQGAIAALAQLRQRILTGAKPVEDEIQNTGAGAGY